MTKGQLLLVKMVATFLMKKNGSTTTLEIKNTLRERFPSENWVQDEISEAMQFIHDHQANGDLTYVDTGKFRVYELNAKPAPSPTGDGKAMYDASTVTTTVAPPKPKKSTVSKVAVNQNGKTGAVAASVAGKTSKLSRTAIVDLMKESKGRFYTVTFIKKDGSERTINGQTKKSNFMDNLGYINFRESNGNQRRVNPQTIKEISISGNVYKVK